MAKKSASTGVRSSRSKRPAEPETTPVARKPRAQRPAPTAKTKRSKAAAKAKSSPAKPAQSTKAAKSGKTAKPAKSAQAKTKARKKTSAVLASAREFPAFPHNPADDPIGDLSDGEGRYSMHGEEPESLVEMAAYRADTADDALEGTLEIVAATTAPAVEVQPAAATGLENETPPTAEPRLESGAGSVSGPGHVHAGPQIQEQPPAKLDRLQKILSQAGVASRRRAEEMILAGRVMVNGQVVTQLGAKADPARDHIRVDGKRIPAAERHRTFMLNKPRGFVTTVSDPEGRPTVMQFFSRMRERLYPVGRLDYDSEGLLLVTNDGELANQLTRAASGVEKTYLVKIAGRPTAEELGRLRSGVFIERGRPGSDQAQTAPARIRELHHAGGSGPARKGAQGRDENPWFEVVLIEGRNRELRKMFQSVGHFVEKIRRVGYGPLVLDLEPGQLRELTPDELARLHLAAEGKVHAPLKPRRFESPRKEQAGRPFEPRSGRRFDARGKGKRERFSERREERGRPGQPASDRSAPSRPFKSHEHGKDRYGNFNSGRGQRPVSRFGSRPEPGPDPGVDPRRDNGERGAKRDSNRGFARAPGGRFGAPRRDFGRHDAAAQNDWSGRRRERFAPKRNEDDRFSSQRGESGRSGPDRFRPNRGGKKRFGNTGHESSRARFRGDLEAGDENPPRRGRSEFSPRSSPQFPARGAEAGFRRGKPKRNHPGGRKRS